MWLEQASLFFHSFVGLIFYKFIEFFMFSKSATSITNFSLYKSGLSHSSPTDFSMCTSTPSILAYVSKCFSGNK
jgi:hypothetical protein